MVGAAGVAAEARGVALRGGRRRDAKPLRDALRLRLGLQRVRGALLLDVGLQRGGARQEVLVDSPDDLGVAAERGRRGRRPLRGGHGGELLRCGALLQAHPSLWRRAQIATQVRSRDPSVAAAGSATSALARSACCSDGHTQRCRNRRDRFEREPVASRERRGQERTRLALAGGAAPP